MPDPTRSALVIVDMQNDLLAEGGALPRRHVDPAQLATTIARLVAAARQQGRTIVWVSSVHGELAVDGTEGQTHTGAPCCVRGSGGAQPLDASSASRGADDLQITQGWCSAFRDTTLHASLVARQISTVLLCGVTTNVCILATARDALQLGLEVEVLADACAADTLKRHLAALDEIEGLGGRRRSWGDLLSAAPVQLTGLGAGGSTLWCGALDEVIGPDSYAILAAEVDWQVMFHRGGEVPRRVAIQGAIEDGAEPLYRHPADEQPAMVYFTPLVNAIRRALERRIGHRLNHCLLQLYRDGRDWIGEHADKTLDLVRPSKIINVSLGRTRTMLLRPKQSAEADTRVVQRIPLPHGSFLEMDLETNRAMFHAIRPELLDRGDAPRISLTFRNIGSFRDPRSGAVWGVGAPTGDRATAEAAARARAALAPEHRLQRDREEAERMLRLFRDENQDPTFDVDAYRPGFAISDLRSMREPA